MNATAPTEIVTQDRCPSVGRAGVDRRALARQHPQSDPAIYQTGGQPDKVREVPAEPVKFPYHQRVARPQRLEASLQPRTTVAPAGGPILVHGLRRHAGRGQCVALEVEPL